MNGEELLNGLLRPSPGSSLSVCEFFSGKDVFITGATGFMGKVLVEKLLWSCEDIGNLYLLIRPKKGLEMSKRIQTMLDFAAFDRLKRRDAKILSKIIPVAGDVMDLNLGLSEHDRKLIEDNVSVVFHVASSVRFDDPLKKAILLNVRGTRDVINLSKNIKNLKVITYVSTAYSNTDKKTIEEKIYTSDIDWRTIIKAAETIDEEYLNVLQAKLLQSRPNTYTYTKYLAENVVYDHRHVLPITVFRPSVVSHSISEPTPGWIDNLNGPMGLSMGVATGVLHAMHGNPSAITDYVPCDFAINGLIAATWYRGIIDTKECITFNAASGDKKKVTAEYTFQTSKEIIMEKPPSHMLWYPGVVVTTNRQLYLFLVLFTHLLPAIVVDTALRFKGINFSLFRLYRKIFIANKALSFFISNEWKIHTKKYYTLQHFMNEKEKKMFPYEIDDLEFELALRVGLNGLKKFILKEDLSTSSIKKARRNLNIMYYADRLLKGALVSIFGWTVFKYSVSLLISAGFL